MQIKQMPTSLGQRKPVFSQLPSSLQTDVFPAVTLLAFYNTEFGQDMGCSVLVVLWAHGMIVNPLQDDTVKQAIVLGAGVAVPVQDSHMFGECHSRWWFTSPTEEELLSAQSCRGQ